MSAVPVVDGGSRRRVRRRFSAISIMGIMVLATFAAGTGAVRADADSAEVGATPVPLVLVPTDSGGEPVTRDGHYEGLPCLGILFAENLWLATCVLHEETSYYEGNSLWRNGTQTDVAHTTFQAFLVGGHAGVWQEEADQREENAHQTTHIWGRGIAAGGAAYALVPVPVGDEDDDGVSYLPVFVQAYILHLSTDYTATDGYGERSGESDATAVLVGIYPGPEVLVGQYHGPPFHERETSTGGRGYVPNLVSIFYYHPAMPAPIWIGYGNVGSFWRVGQHDDGSECRTRADFENRAVWFGDLTPYRVYQDLGPCVVAIPRVPQAPALPWPGEANGVLSSRGVVPS